MITLYSHHVNVWISSNDVKRIFILVTVRAFWRVKETGDIQLEDSSANKLFFIPCHEEYSQSESWKAVVYSVHSTEPDGDHELCSIPRVVFFAVFRSSPWCCVTTHSKMNLWTEPWSVLPLQYSRNIFGFPSDVFGNIRRKVGKLTVAFEWLL